MSFCFGFCQCKTKKVEIMECPACRSKKMNLLPWLGIIYECPKCGYRGPVALEKKKIKNRK